MPLLAIFVLGIFPIVLAASSNGNCAATVDAVFKLPNTKLEELNPFLSTDRDYLDLRRAGCPSNRDEGTVCADKPAIGSGITQINFRRFLGLTDRGPNQDCEDLAKLDPVKYSEAVGKKGKGFPVKNFAPTIVHFRRSRRLKQIRLRRKLPLLDKNRNPISGLPNTEFDDTPYAKDCKGDPLPLDPAGLDTEDLARIPGTSYVAIVDEYSPSVVIANFKTGVIASRHVPGVRLDRLKDAQKRYNIVGDIPDIYASRRNNRGFEGVVVDPKGTYVIAIMQSPMLGEDSDKTENNAIIRCAYFKVKKRGSDAPVLSYKKSFIFEASPPSAYLDKKNVPKDMKYSGAQYAESGKFFALERAIGQVKLFLVDFSSASNIDETKYGDNLGLESDTNGKLTAAQVGIVAAKKTLIWESIPGVGGTDDFDGLSKQEGFVIDRKDRSKLWIIDDNDFGLERSGPTELRKISLGRSVSGSTVCSPPRHPRAPRINTEPSKAIALVNSQTFRIEDKPGVGAAENLDVGEDKRLAYVANGNSGSIDAYDISSAPVTFKRSFSAGKDFEPTSTAVCKVNGVVAAGFGSKKGDAFPGKVLLLDGADLTVKQEINNPNCFLPDNLKWSHDCRFLVVACEGEGADVPGGILVADYGGPNGAFRGEIVANFRAYDLIKDKVKAKGIRLIESDKPSLDLEPEGVAIVGKNAFVTLQESNALAVVDLYEAVITELRPLGFINRALPGFGLDASDKDDKINIRNYQGLFGMPQPDAIVSYVAPKDDKPYLVYVNEGDAKDSEEARAEDITDKKKLNRNADPLIKKLIEDKKLLGRLKISTIMGFDKKTNTQKNLFHFGSRSFSIASLDGKIVFDSGEWFARIQEKLFPAIFNADSTDDDDLDASQADLFDKRSDDKGMEPESLSIVTKAGKSYAFIGFDRSSIIVVFDISDPRNPIFVNAVQNHPIREPIKTVFSQRKQGDLDPEGLFASGKFSKLFVAGSRSSTVSSYDIIGM